MNANPSLSARANRALVIKLFAAASTYGFSILLARTMAAPDFGRVVFFLNTALILSVVGARGQQLAALRFLPQFRFTPDGTVAFANSAYITAAKGTIVVFGTALCVGFAARNLGFLAGSSLLQIWLGLALIPLVGWVDLQSHLARGFHLIDLSLIPKEIIWRSGAALLVAGVFWSQNLQPLGASTVLAILLMVLIGVTYMQGLILFRKTGIAPPLNIHRPEPPDDVQGTTNHFWVTSVSNIFLANADVILVGLFAGTTVAGYYFAANRLAMLLAFILTSYNVVLGPMLAQAWQQNGPSQTQTIVHAATRKTTLPTALLGLLLAGFAPQFLHLFGSEFTQATPFLWVLIIAGVINAATGPADIALNMCGFQRQVMWASTISLLFSAAALVLGGALGGAMGISLAVLAATIFRKGLFWWLAFCHMSLRCDIFAARGSNSRFYSVARK